MKKGKKFNSMAELHAAAVRSSNRFANLGGTNDMALMTSDTAIMPRYIGQNDPTLDISGNVQNFIQEGDVSKQIILTIQNTATSLRTAQLFAGYNTNNATVRPGQLKDGAFQDIGGNDGLVGSSGRSGITVAEIMQYLREVPTRVVMIRIKSTVANQLDQTIQVNTLDIFADKAGLTLYPSTGVNGSTFNDKISDIQTNIQLDAFADIKYSFVPSSTTTITLFCGASLNKALWLKRKAEVAQTNINGY